jgi:hypothetical protein
MFHSEFNPNETPNTLQSVHNVYKLPDEEWDCPKTKAIKLNVLTIVR